MNWGKSIVLAFVLFAVFIGVLVTVCIRQDISLVAEDYYQEELAYQEQIERINNANRLEHKPAVSISENGFLKVQFDKSFVIEKGEVNLFCPSNERFDKKFEIHLSPENEQLLPLDQMGRGMYQAKLSWTMDGKEFYMVEIINI